MRKLLIQGRQVLDRCLLYNLSYCVNTKHSCVSLCVTMKCSDELNGHQCTSPKVCLSMKVSGPFVETSCVFQCIRNIINAEMWA